MVWSLSSEVPAPYFLTASLDALICARASRASTQAWPWSKMGRG